MSSRWMVWKGLLLVLPGVMYWPLTKGTVLPTMMEAGSLSRVSRFGGTARCCLPGLHRARQHAQVGDLANAGNVDGARDHADAQAALGQGLMEFFPPGVKVSLPKFAPPNTRPPPASH